MSLTAAIIAGGLSKRFGSPKALAEFKGKRLIDHALELAHEVADNVLVSCGQSFLPLGEEVQQVGDKVSNCGPIGGLLSALDACETDWLAIMPCDMPLLTVDIYKKLLSHKQDESGVVAVSRFGLQPLVSIWPVSARRIVSEQIIRQKYSMRALLRESQSGEVSFASDVYLTSFQNVNTEFELEKMKQKMTRA